MRLAAATVALLGLLLAAPGGGQVQIPADLDAGPDGALPSSPPATAPVAEPADVEASYLDVDVLLLDPGLPDNPALSRLMDVYPKVRQVESRYLAVGLRHALVESGRFAAVRVVPERDPAAELTVAGVIVKSDGEVLELAVRAVDAAGVVWLDAGYRLSLASLAADREPGSRSRSSIVRRRDGVRRDTVLTPLFTQIVNALVSQLDARAGAELERVREISSLRYAAELVPDQFGGYLAEAEDGTLVARRLPARDDPMLRRIRRVRFTDLQFKDTVDRLYAEAYDDVAEPYALWREYRARQEDYVEDREERLSAADRRSTGTYAALRYSYENYKWAKVQEQTLDRLALRFDSEVSPSVTELEGQVVELSGSIEAQYAQWREYLREIFALESGRSGTTP
jgi:hypothetical protein